MSQNRGKQKQLAKRKKKRDLAGSKRRTPGFALPTSPAALVREAARLPVGPSFITSNSTSGDEKGAPLVSVVVTRKVPGGMLIPALALVDRTCLGVKNGFVGRPMSRSDLDEFLEQAGERQDGFEERDLIVAQSIVFHALDYARSLGFTPHPDFPELLFGPRPAVLVDTPSARPTKPLYVSGPDDDPVRIIEQLRRVVGEGNFDFVVGTDPFALDDEHDDDGGVIETEGVDVVESEPARPRG